MWCVCAREHWNDILRGCFDVMQFTASPRAIRGNWYGVIDLNANICMYGISGLVFIKFANCNSIKLSSRSRPISSSIPSSIRVNIWFIFLKSEYNAIRLGSGKQNYRKLHSENESEIIRQTNHLPVGVFIFGRVNWTHPKWKTVKHSDILRIQRRSEILFRS